MSQLVKPYTFWFNNTGKAIRKFVVVDIPLNQADSVVVMEILPYKKEEERKFQRIPYSDWIELTEVKQDLKEFVPKL